MHQDVDMRKAFIICLIVSALTGCVGSDTEAEAFSAAKKKTTKKEMTLEAVSYTHLTLPTKA